MPSLHLARDEPCDDVSRVHVDGAYRHDLLPLLPRQLPQQERDERVQLLDLGAGGDSGERCNYFNFHNLNYFELVGYQVR